MNRTWTLRQWFGWFAVLGVCLAMLRGLYRVVDTARDEAQVSACHGGHMFQLSCALRQYHAVHGHFPPAWVEGPDGKPWHSWRLLLLPYLNQEQLYKQYRFDEPWNGPNNRRLASQLRNSSFQCSAGDDYNHTPITNFVVVTGEGTLFPGSKNVSIGDLLASTDRRILLVELTDSDIHWMEPRDLPLHDVPAPGRPRFGSSHRTTAGIIRANGRYESLPKDLPLEQLWQESVAPAEVPAEE